LENLQGLIVKKLSDYLNESAFAAENPVTGDVFAINIREECLIESVVVESRNDGVVIAADDRMIELLESYGYTFEENCMECGMHECGCGDPAAYSDDDEPDAGQNPGEYDQEGDMAKDELLTVIRSARKLIGMLDNDDNMPEWTQKKITKSADYVDTAADYIASQKERGVMEQSADEITVGDIVMLAAGYADTDEKFRVVDVDSDGETCTIKSMETGIVTDEVFTDELEKVNNSSQGVAEGSGETSPVARATLHRIMMRHPGMLAQHGPERVMKAVDDVADLVGDMDDIGSSDISGWVNMVQEILDSLDQGVAEGSLNEAATKASVSKLLRHIERHHPTWFDDYGMGEVEDTVVDMAEQGTFSGMTVVNAAALVGKELESMYGADAMSEAEYQGRKVQLGKPMQGDVAKSKVYVKDPKTGNVKKVNFGDPNMSIKKSNPERRKSFRARHNCDNPGPRTKARYWSCRAW
jgi:hypothetical protein